MNQFKAGMLTNSTVSILENSIISYLSYVPVENKVKALSELIDHCRRMRF